MNWLTKSSSRPAASLGTPLLWTLISLKMEYLLDGGMRAGAKTCTSFQIVFRCKYQETGHLKFSNLFKIKFQSGERLPRAKLTSCDQESSDSLGIKEETG